MRAKHVVVIGCPDLKKAGDRALIPVTLIADGNEAKHAIPKLVGPEIFVLNVLFPYGNAYEVAPIIRHCHPDAAIWLMSARADDMREEIEKDANFDRMVNWSSEYELVLDALRSS